MSKISHALRALAPPACAVVLAVAPSLATEARATEVTIYNLGQHAHDGSLPNGDLARDAQGNLFGTTVFGGTSASSSGVVYEVSPPTTAGGPWTETVIHDFAGGADGYDPQGGLVLDPHGNVYGTTFDSGTSGGTMFELLRPARGGQWTKKLLHRFSLSDGSNPIGRLVRTTTGTFYGATFSGGAHYIGAIYRLTPLATAPNGYTLSVIYSFSGQADGFAPQAGLVADVVGNLYGTAASGGTAARGTAFRLNRPASAAGAWTITILHSFGGTGDGATPMAELAIDAAGHLFGTTRWGGANDKGIVFELSPPSTATGAWGYRIIHQFAGPDGSGPSGGAPVPDTLGNLYGTTQQGGNSGAPGFGAVFKLARPAAATGTWRASVPFSFTGNMQGSAPSGGLIAAPGGHFFGTALGGTSGGGVVFELTP